MEPRSAPFAIVRALRPRQWAKNVFVFAALVFAGRLSDHAAVSAVFGAFAVFCALSSAVYLLNDLRDVEADRAHPVKRRRPIAAGELAPATAAILAAVLGGAALFAAFRLPGLFAVAVAYLLLNLGYSFGLKRVVILDVMMVAAGFLLRAIAGARVIEVEISHWLVLCTGLLALFLGFVKRRQELSVAGLEGAPTRAILKEYSLPFLDQMISVVTGATVVAYSLYAFSSEVAEKLGTEHLGLTIPFVLFGIFRYLYLVHQRGAGENPTAVVLTDLPLVLDVVFWGVSVLVALYVWR